MRRGHKKRGSILILSLWALSFLGIFALNIGLRVRQRAMLISRIENRSQLRYIAQAGIKKAISSLRLDLGRNNFRLTNDSKVYRHNNTDKFSNIILGNGVDEVSYLLTGQDYPNPVKQYGVVDEERKININFADESTLVRLFENVLGGDSDEARSLADAIIEWRAYGQSQIVGFYSDAYYSNLEFPYEPKNSEFQIIDELLLVQGFDEGIFHELLPFITIYGDGRVNINTAPREVLLALGFSPEVAEKILSARRGEDGLDATYDDFIFSKGFDIASEVNGLVGLTEGQMKEIDIMNQRDIIKNTSIIYLIESAGMINNKKTALLVKCVYDSAENKVIYWREK